MWLCELTKWQISIMLLVTYSYACMKCMIAFVALQLLPWPLSLSSVIKKDNCTRKYYVPSSVCSPRCWTVEISWRWKKSSKEMGGWMSAWIQEATPQRMACVHIFRKLFAAGTALPIYFGSTGSGTSFATCPSVMWLVFITHLCNELTLFLLFLLQQFSHASRFFYAAINEKLCSKMTSYAPYGRWKTHWILKAGPVYSNVLWS